MALLFCILAVLTRCHDHGYAGAMVVLVNISASFIIFPCLSGKGLDDISDETLRNGVFIRDYRNRNLLGGPMCP